MGEILPISDMICTSFQHWICWYDGDEARSQHRNARESLPYTLAIIE